LPWAPCEMWSPADGGRGCFTAGDPDGFGSGGESVSRPPHASPGIQIKFTRGGKDPARSAGGRVQRMIGGGRSSPRPLGPFYGPCTEPDLNAGRHTARRLTDRSPGPKPSGRGKARGRLRAPAAPVPPKETIHRRLDGPALTQRSPLPRLLGGLRSLWGRTSLIGSRVAVVSSER
jgi:hypothetical protein